jgi:hypothetical protein
MKSEPRRGRQPTIPPLQLAARLNTVLAERFIDWFPDDLQRQSIVKEVAERYQPGDTPWHVQAWEDLRPRGPFMDCPPKWVCTALTEIERLAE